MGEVINLNKIRKAREKAAAQAQATENRTKHGRTKADRKLDDAQSEKARKALDAHKREQDSD
jgi:hypothetical protein